LIVIDSFIGATLRGGRVDSGIPHRNASAVGDDRRVVLIGPTVAPSGELASDVIADLARLARPGVELVYRHVREGPDAITSDADSTQAEPHVVAAVLEAEREGFEAAIVDCTDDPGVARARSQARIPVVGAGEALRDAITRAAPPVVVLPGDLLRSAPEEELLERVAGAATVALGGTGWSHLVPMLAGEGRVVLDPLDVALARCLAELAGGDRPGQAG
jgi:Asp/Glu/hydantoin racemase